MLKRKSIVLVVAIALVAMMAVLAGCSTQTSTPPVDEDTILKEAAAEYFNKLPAHINKINPDELKDLIANNPDSIYILDIRSAADYAAGHVAGAVNVPFKEVGSKFDQLPKGKTIIVICYTGQTAGQTVAALNIGGFNARALHLGMGSWKAEEGYETVTD